MSLKPRRSLGAVTVLVRDYDEAIAWFTAALGFVLVEDTDGGKRSATKPTTTRVP